VLAKSPAAGDDNLIRPGRIKANASRTDQ
jgi:hypothetical protein